MQKVGSAGSEAWNGLHAVKLELTADFKCLAEIFWPTTSNRQEHEQLDLFQSSHRGT